VSKKPSARSRLAAVGDWLASFDPPPPVRRFARAAGYPAFAIFVMLTTFSAALPDDRIKDRLETLLSQDPTTQQPMGLGVDVKAGDLSMSLLRRGISAENVVLRTRPVRATDKPARYVLDTVKVNVGLFGLMFARPTYAFTIDAFKGLIEGTARVTMTDNHYHIEVSDVELGAMQGLQTALGPPLDGKLTGKLELEAPGRLLANSNGTLELDVDNVSFGDGKAKLVIPGDAFMSQGLTFPKVRLGKVAAAVTIEKGKARIDQFVAHSPDVDVTLEGYVDLRDPFPSSSLHLFLRFKLNEALVKREATLELATSGLSAQGKRPDGFIGAQITGSFASPFFKADKAPPPGVTSKHDNGVPPPPPSSTPAPAPAPPAAAPDAAQAPPPPPEPKKEEPMSPTTPMQGMPGMPTIPPRVNIPHAEEGGTQPPPAPDAQPAAGP
jgi:type II secretion system protein N